MKKKKVLWWVGICGAVMIVVLVCLIQQWSGMVGNEYPINEEKKPALTQKAIEDAVYPPSQWRKDIDGFVLRAGSAETTGWSTLSSATRGDLNNDGQEDAVVIAGTCGASCGYEIKVLLNQNGKAKNIGTVDDSEFRKDLPHSLWPMARPAKIQNGILYIDYTGYTAQGLNTKFTVKYKVTGTKITKVL